MPCNFDILKQKDVVSALNDLTSLIDDTHTEVYELAIKTKNHTDRYFNEYGFYIDSKDKSALLFFGMWYSFWEETGNALCLMYSWDTPGEPGFKQKFKDFVEARPEIFAGVIDFEKVPVATYNSEYLKGLEDGKQMATIINELIQFLGLDYEKTKR
jgi:hypothetical protein